MNLFQNIFGKKSVPTVRRIGVSMNHNARAFAANRNRAHLAKKQTPNNDLQIRTLEAAQGTRYTSDWINISRSINYDIRSGIATIRDRARYLAWNEPLCVKFLSMCKKNIVGPNGFVFRNKAFDFVAENKDGKTNYKKVYDKAANTLIQDKFWEWCKKQYCSITKDIPFTQLCQLIVRAVAVDGEVFIVKHKGPNYNKFGFTLQIVESDFVDEKLQRELPGGGFIDMGIEYDANRAPVAYYFKKAKNNDYDLYGMMTTRDYERVEADRVIHLYVKETPSQRRGISWLVPVTVRMKMLNGLQEAALVNMRVAACATAILKPTERANQEFTGSGKDSDGNTEVEFAPGEILRVPMGWDVSSFEPKFPGETFLPAVREAKRDIAGALDVSSNFLSSEFESVNFASGRLSVGDEREGWIIKQNWLCDGFLMDIQPEWLEMALLKEINLPIEKYDKFNKGEFYGRRWPYTNPADEEAANEKGLNNKTKTYEMILSEQGIDVEDHFEQLAYEERLAKELGLSPRPSGNTNTGNAKENNSTDNTDNKNTANKRNGSLINAN